MVIGMTASAKRTQASKRFRCTGVAPCSLNSPRRQLDIPIIFLGSFDECMPTQKEDMRKFTQQFADSCNDDNVTAYQLVYKRPSGDQ